MTCSLPNNYQTAPISQQGLHRLPGFDYGTCGAYAITICTYGRKHILSGIQEGTVHLTPVGEIIGEFWRRIPQHYPGTALGEFVVMPNHFHDVLFIQPDVPTGLSSQSGSQSRPTVPEIIRSFKKFSAIAANKMLGQIGQPFWQRNYYEHVVRGPRNLAAVEQYIRDNPRNWDKDPENIELKRA